MAQKLKKLNPEGRFIVLSWQLIWIQEIDLESMICPEDYYYDPKQRIIRRTSSLIDHFYVSASGEA